MTLRLRLALTLLIAAIPLYFAVSWFRADIERRRVEARIEGWVLDQMTLWGGIAACADGPESWGGNLSPERRGPRRETLRTGRRSPRRGAAALFPDSELLPRSQKRPPLAASLIWAYDKTFVSRNSRAPAFPDELRRRLEQGIDVASQSGEHPRAARTTESNDGPSKPPATSTNEWLEFGMRLHTREEACAYVLFAGAPRWPKDQLWWMPLVAPAAMLVIVLLAAGPMVGRIRQLTGQVGESAATHYETQVTVGGRDEIAGLAHAFNRAGTQVRAHLEDVEARERTLRDFIANTTHDVMIPLTVLQGHLSDLRKKAGTGESVNVRTIASSLNEAHYIGSILQNLSAAAKLENTDLQIRQDRVDLNALVERSVERHRPLASARGIGIDYSVPEQVVEVLGDVTLIEQAVSNVIHNAVRYNKEQGNIAVLLEANGRPGAAQSGFRLKVIDDGPGIDAAERERLFERRFRGSAARTREPGGLGLGLYIARDVCERHNFGLSLNESEFGGLEVEFSSG